MIVKIRMIIFKLLALRILKWMILSKKIKKAYKNSQVEVYNLVIINKVNLAIKDLQFQLALGKYVSQVEISEVVDIKIKADKIFLKIALHTNRVEVIIRISISNRKLV